MLSRTAMLQSLRDLSSVYNYMLYFCLCMLRFKQCFIDNWIANDKTEMQIMLYI